jgi:serine/threonine protein kinase
MSQLIGQILGDRYQLQSLLGRKTGRRTFRAIDLETESPVVIKLLLFSPDFTWDDLKLFEREAETLKSLDHPAIPEYLNFFEVETELGKGFVLVQSYIEARSLQEWVQSGRTFSEEELKEIATQLLEVLEYLHTRQPPVIHRDIKPSNVLLENRSGNSPGQVYLVDFGSVQTAAHGGTVTIVGTYGYMPPEQFGGRSLPASDLYSVGATLIYLASGQHPADLPQKDLHIEFESSASLSQPFLRWIQCLTNPVLSKRPASATIAIQLLQQNLQESSSSLSIQPFSVGIARPGSKIQLQKTPATLEITVPFNQFRSQNFNQEMAKITIEGCGCSITFLIIFFSMLYLGGVSFFICVLFLILFQALLPKKNSPPCKIILQWKGGSIYADVIPDIFKNSDNFSQGKLKGLYAGHNDVPKYCLSLDCSTNSLYITGSRAEIQWLCDELNEWTGIEIRYRNYRSSA